MKNKAAPLRTEQFGLALWHGIVSQPGPPHRHSEIELNMVESGFMHYLFGGRHVTVSAGELGIFWATIPHYVIERGPATSTYWITLPLADFLGWRLPLHFTRALLAGQFIVTPQAAIQPHTLNSFAIWCDDLQAETAARREIAVAEIQTMLRRLALHQDTNDPQPHSAERHRGIDDKAAQMAHFMSTHYRDVITVGAIADHVGLHPNYAMAVFKKAFGISLLDYLTQQRVAYAQQRLLTSDEGVADVAYDAGFQSVSRFYVVFKAHCGIAPGQYRSNLRRLAPREP